MVFEAECESRYWSDLFLSFYLWFALKYYLCLPFSPSPLFPTDLMYLLLPLYTRFLLKRALGLFKQWDSTLKSSLWSSYLLHNHVFFLFIFLFSLLASPELYLLLFISKYSSWCSISDLNGKECISLGGHVVICQFILYMYHFKTPFIYTRVYQKLKAQILFLN